MLTHHPCGDGGGVNKREGKEEHRSKRGRINKERWEMVLEEGREGVRRSDGEVVRGWRAERDVPPVFHVERRGVRTDTKERAEVGLSACV